MLLEESLKRYFGYNSFREHQKEIIGALLEKKDVLAILPTGAGKSVCYQLPALLFPSVTVVISPLISLMQDQVISLSKDGLPAAFLNSSLPYDEIQSVLNDLQAFKLLYVAPERFSDSRFVQRLQEVSISLFAIDEAHCISQWGHSFRPDYRQLSRLKKEFPLTPIIALTATATYEVKADITAQLLLEKPLMVQASFDRPNLSFFVKPEKNAVHQLHEFLAKHEKNSGIIYAATRSRVDETYEALKQEGMQVGKYHAGLSDQERAQMQSDFLYGSVRIMVATVAFGMGIHKPDIRFVVHIDMPRSLEQYYQEIGRAGRDGLAAECLMLYSAKQMKLYSLFADQMGDEALSKMARVKADKMYRFCTTPKCRRKELLKYFGEVYEPSSCEGCDHCLEKQELVDETIAAQKILSCIYRLEQRFGINYVIDVLRGAKIKEIYDRKHDRLSTYGIMAEYRESDLRYYMDVLIEQGWLERSEGQYPVLRWTDKSSLLTKGKETLMIPKRQMKENSRALKKELVYDGELFSRLAQIRKELAEESKVPAFVIFGDRSLIEMCRIYPTNQEMMMRINGVGPIKWIKYGSIFLDAIQKYQAETNRSNYETYSSQNSC